MYADTSFVQIVALLGLPQCKAENVSLHKNIKRNKKKKPVHYVPILEVGSLGQFLGVLLHLPIRSRTGLS